MRIRQQHNFVESRGNKVFVVVVVADTVAGASDPLSVADIETNILQMSTIKKDLEVSVGAFAVDEIEFTVDESMVSTEDDATALEFILEGQYQESRRFVTVWLFDHAIPAEYDPDAADMRGIILPDVSAEEIEWHGEQWDMNPAPLRVWKIKAQSLDVNILDEKLEVMFKQPTMSAIYSSAFSHLSHFKSGGFSVINVLLVSLSDALNHLASVYNSIPDEQRTVSNGGITIEFGESPIQSYSLSPARWNTVDYSLNFEAPNPFNPVPFPSPVGIADFEDDAFVPVLFGSDPKRDLYVSLSLLFPALTELGEDTGERAYSWLKYETFSELLFDITRTLGLYIQFSFIENDRVQILFRSRNSLSSNNLEVRDVVSASLDSEASEMSDRKPFVARGTRFSNDGRRLLKFNKDNTFFEQERGFVPEGDSERLPLSISPQIAYYDHMIGKVGFAGRGHWQMVTCSLPVNTMTGGNADNANGYEILHQWAREYWGGHFADFGRRDLTTALYCRRSARNEFIEGPRDYTLYEWVDTWRGGYFDGQEYGPEATGAPDVVVPVGMLHCVIDGEQRDFKTLTAYVNELAARDASFFEREYQIDVPYISGGFRTVGETASSWRALRLGATVTLDGISYNVVGLERDFAQVSTRLRLQSATRSALLPADGRIPTGEPSETELFIPVSALPLDDIDGMMKVTASELIGVGVPVAVMDDGQAVEASAHSDFYGKVVGISAQIIPPSAQGYVYIEGSEVFVPEAEVLPNGTKIFLRDMPPYNMSDTPPAIGSAETLYQVMGFMRDGNLVVSIGSPYTIEQP